jgi:hypothetical protein
MAFVEEKFLREEAGEGGPALDAGFDGAERKGAALALGAGESDMGMEGTGFGQEAAERGRRSDALLK